MTAVPLFSQLCSAFDRNRLGHALLFIESGKDRAFTPDLLRFIQGLCCRAPRPAGPTPSVACGRCESCLIFTKDFSEFPVHPDLYALTPENEFAYSVEQIRGLSERLSLSRSLSPNRVVLLARADALSGGASASANAFLKLLEEPRPNTFLVLTTARPASVLATVRSRCQVFRFSIIGEDTGDAQARLAEFGFEELAAWLARGAPQPAEFRCPFDSEAFWKKKSSELDLSGGFIEQLWQATKLSWSQLAREDQHRVLDFFSAFDGFLAKLRFHAQGHLQWLHLRGSLAASLE